MSKAQKQECQCGCGKADYHSRLVQVAIEQATDISLRETRTAKRFWVLKECEKDFLEELGLMVLLEQLVRAYVPEARSRYWLIRFWFDPSRPFQLLYHWWRRVGAARKVMQITHSTYERTKGFDYARDKALRSAILFGAPRFLQGFLARRFLIREKRKARDAARPPVANQETA